jgi:hypothetical protein
MLHADNHLVHMRCGVVLEVTGTAGYKNPTVSVHKTPRNKPMEPFSADEVASVLGVPLAATPPRAPLKVATYAGLFSWRRAQQMAKLRGKSVSTETVALRRTAISCAVAGA